MSNNKNIEDFKAMEFLATPEFPTILSENNLDFLHHNKIYVAHLIGILSQSSNIVGANIEIYYDDGKYDYNVKRKIPVPKINYDIISYSGKHITNNNSPAIGEKIFHKKYNFHSATELQNFMNKKEKEMRQLDYQELILFSERDISRYDTFNINFEKTEHYNYIDRQAYILDSVEKCDENIRKFLHFHSLQKRWGVTGTYIPTKPKVRKI